MDTSETYIKMCDCPEIQKKWIKENGDYYFGRYDPCSPDDPCYGGYIEEEVRVYSRLEAYMGDMRWLPRQDQIQAIVDGSWVIAFEDFDEWYFNKSYPDGTYPNDVFTSMEQLWLAFYMSEKHQKFWDGEQWKKK